MLQTATIKFLKDLKKNNNRPWFEEHRSAYEASSTDFSGFIETLLRKNEKNDEDLGPLQAKACLFRINRDVRFSKDKSPYKTNMGASMKRDGKKSVFAGYYFHLEPGQSFAGGGIWMPEPDLVKKIRQEIDYCFDEFKSIIKSPGFVSVHGDLGKGEEYSLVNIPKGYEKDNPAADYLKLKSWVAMKPVSDAELVSKDLVKIVTETFKALQPLVKFINRALE